MEVTLKVLSGAKQGGKIAVKKSPFTIGRSQDCHLSAGSTAISRKHCALTRTENKLTVKDLGSRNGTLVNGEKIAEEVELKSGDELTIGPLKFQVRISSGLKNEKRPQVKSVAEAVSRASEAPTGEFDPDDITSWLSESATLPSDSSTSALNETQSIQLDDTNAIQLESKASESAETTAVDTASLAGDGESDDGKAEEAEAENAGGSKKGKKKEPGKLPPVPAKTGSKDSREAAADALRTWSRRR